eukprot:gene6439-7718_t
MPCGEELDRVLVTCRQLLEEDGAEKTEPVLFQLAVASGGLNDDATFAACLAICRRLPLTVACELVGGRDTGPRLSAGPAIVCFDEFQVTDAFTAVALKAVCEILLEEGVVIVATANRHPQSLNTDGSIKSDVFQPFAQKLEEWCAPTEIAAGVDYRRRAAREALANPTNLQRTYFYPLGEQSTADMEAHFREVTGADTSETEPTTLEVLFGRQLEVQRSRQGAAIFTFEELCDCPLGAADYIALAQTFHTVYVAGVPEMSRYSMNQARRTTFPSRGYYKVSAMGREAANERVAAIRWEAANGQVAAIRWEAANGQVAAIRWEAANGRVAANLWEAANGQVAAIRWEAANGQVAANR